MTAVPRPLRRARPGPLPGSPESRRRSRPRPRPGSGGHGPGTGSGRGRREPGFILMFTAGLLTALVGMVAIVVDSGRALRAKSDAFGSAAAAARAGSQEIDEGYAVQHGQVRLDPSAASAAADDHMQARGWDGTVTVTADTVTVTVSDSTAFLMLPGSASFTVSATATAIQGVPGS